MSDRMTAEITLGGPVPLYLVRRLCRAITEEGVALAWGDAPFVPSTAEHLLAARRDDDGIGIQVLPLYGDEVAYGEFSHLEGFLQRHKLAYRRFSEAKYEHDAQVVEYRPALGEVCFPANQAGEPLVSLARFRGATQALDKGLALLDRGFPQAARVELATAIAALHGDVPPEIPPLEPFEIVKGGASAA